MNHPSEWMKIFDQRAGQYRYRHKGSGVIRDTLMAIGRKFTRQQNKLSEPSPPKQELGKTIEKVDENGAEKIRQLLRKRAVQPGSLPVIGDAMWKLTQILANRL